MKSSKYTLIIVVVLQIILCVIAFNKFFSAPNNYMFQAHYDGFKNYMTFQTYLSQPNDDILKYSQMNYPYGEYIFYTDNSPLFAVPLKFFCNYIYDFSAYSVLIYNVIIIFGYFISAILLYLILKRFIKNKWFLVLFSVALSWVHPQMLRPFVGHHNLGLACILLFNILASLKIKEAKNGKQEWKWLIMLTLSLIGSGFIHLYYLLINGFFVGFWGLAWTIDDFINKRNWKKTLLKTWSVALIGILFCFVTIRLIDGEYLNRSIAKGYNWGEWSLKLKAIFVAYDFNTIQTIMSKETLNIETYTYLGAAAIFTLIGLFVLIIIRKIGLLKPYFQTLLQSKNRIVLHWFFAGIMMTFIALGSVIHTDNFHINNLLNILFYADFFSEKFAQFRCLGRFSWFLFWSVNIILAILLANIWETSKYKILKYITIGLMLMLVVDAVDFVKYINKTHERNQFVDEVQIQEYKGLSKHINAVDFQAILPIPFFHTGTEVYDLTIDAPGKWLNSMGKLSYLTDLPLMASQMSRTPPYQAEELYSIFSEDKISPNLLNKLNKKPILVVVSNYYKNPDHASWFRNSDSLKYVGLEGHHIIEEYDMTLIHQSNNYNLYSWDLSTLD